MQAATESSTQNFRLGLLGLANVCQESSSPEPTSGSVSGTNQAFYGRLHTDFLEEDNDPYDFNHLMDNHMRMRVIQEQSERSQAESHVDNSEMNPQSPVSGMKSSNLQ